MGTTGDHRGQRRVLVVEDDESAAVFVTKVLDRAGFDFTWAVDADEASSLLATNRFDVLLTDFRLPGRSGLELVRQTRSSQPALAIAVMTSFNESGLESEARSWGADDFFEKPLSPASLVSRISELADRSVGHEEPDEDAADRPPAERRAAGSGPGAAPAAPEQGRDAGAVCVETPGPADASPLEEAEDVRPVFRWIGSARRPLFAVPLWASAPPVVFDIISGTGPVATPRTSAAWRLVE